MPEPGATVIGRARRIERQDAGGVASREAMGEQRELAKAGGLTWRAAAWPSGTKAARRRQVNGRQRRSGPGYGRRAT